MTEITLAEALNTTPTHTTGTYANNGPYTFTRLPRYTFHFLNQKLAPIID